jgi:hypothetical protein
MEKVKVQQHFCQHGGEGTDIEEEPHAVCCL